MALMQRFTRILAVAALGLTGVTLGVSAGSASAAHAKRATMHNISVGVLPIADVAPLYVGMKQGFFAAQHLKVIPHVLQGGAAVASAVVGGSLEFGFGATANIVLAASHNLPVQFVANGDQAASSASSAWSGILVSASSGITSISQLAGKTIATNALEGENELALDAVLAQNGVSPSSVKIVVLGFPDMPAALASGSVDAVTEVEPFVSAIEAKGGKLLSPLFEGMQPSMLVAGYFANTGLIHSNPTLVKSFITAMNKSLVYAQTHPAAVRAAVLTYTQIPSTVVANMKLPVWGAAVQTTSIKTQENLMHRFGWISGVLPVSRLVWSGAVR
jgi:NitT/TauT family transport system substrate-binding protein